MASRLFKRGARLLLTSPALVANQIEIVGLRVAFNLEKGINSEPNTGEIIVTNLSSDTRAELQRKPLAVRLEVGYDGELERLFVGDARYVSSQRDGADWVTKIQLGDGERTYQFSRVNRSFKRGVSVGAAVREVAGAMGLPLNSNANLADLDNKEFVSGLTLSGPGRRELNRLLAPYGKEWSIQDGRLQVLSEAEARFDQAVLVSQDTGMIGSPTFGTPEKAKKNPILNVKMLLYPGLTPGGKLQVVSNNINGLFRVEKVKHTGDTRGEDWFSEIEARQYDGE